MSPRTRDATATSSRSRLSRKPRLASSNCVKLAAPTVRLPQPSTQRGTSPAGPSPGRLQPCAISRLGRSATDRAPGRAVARSPKRGAGTSSPVSKCPAGREGAPSQAKAPADSRTPLSRQPCCT
jgi:hypothetical protein